MIWFAFVPCSFILIYGYVATKGLPSGPHQSSLLTAYDMVEDWTDPFPRYDMPTDPPLWLSGRLFAASPNLREAQLSSLLPNDQDIDAARARYRGDWCRRVGHPPALCGTLPSNRYAIPAYQQAMREDWCGSKARELSSKDCSAHFARKDDEFDREWLDFRSAQIAALAKPDMRNRDLRNSDLAFASIVGVDLAGARLQGSDLGWAQMEGANLLTAQMQRANLVDAQMEGAILFGAQMEGANLGGAQMQRAELFGAQMEEANLVDAQMEGANLSGAQMQRANLGGAQMEGTILFRAQMEGADLADTQMEGASFIEAHFDDATDFRPATLRAAGLKSVDLSMLDIDPKILAGAFGDATVILPDGLSAGEPPLAHWSTEVLEFYPFDEESLPFHIAWRAFQEEIGYQPRGPD